jgi:DDE superfamily endonuclease
MDKEMMLEWIEIFWKPAVAGNKQLYLILDECRPHSTTLVRKTFADRQQMSNLIPNGHTSKLQPIDVGINKPFITFIRGHFHAWLAVNRRTRPSRKDVSGWVSGVWKTISESVARN